MKLLLSFCTIILLLFSCVSPVEKPEDLLSKSDFVNILTDYYLYKNPSIQTAVNTSNTNELNYYVLSKHRVSGKQFLASYKYYMTKDNDARSILKQVEEKIKEQGKDWKVYEEPTEKEPDNSVK